MGQPVYDVQAYHCSLDFGQGYTLVPRSIFQYELRGSAFVVCLYLYFCLGNSSRAFPSLSRISSVLWMARSTVCQALACLREAGCILRQHCARANRTFSAWSRLYLLCWPRLPLPWLPCGLLFHAFIVAQIPLPHKTGE